MGTGTTLFLLALSTAGCWAVKTDHFVFKHEVCSAGILDPYLTLNGAGDLEGGIFHSLSFFCEGKVSRWEFNAINTGVFYAAVYDVDHKTNKLTLMGSNEIVVTETGPQEYVVDPVKKIYVEPGYVVGIHYDSHATQAVLSWERSGQPTTTAGVMLSQYQPAGKGLEAGTVVNKAILPADRATPALKAIVQGSATNLRLMPEDAYTEGRVEVYLDGEWGTVCDLWYEVLGWPNVVCVEMGFPGAAAANYTNNPSITFPGDKDRYTIPKDQRDQYPIHMMNPKCKLSDKMKFASCDLVNQIHECGHNKDVYVKCLPKMKCGRERTVEQTSNRYTRWVTRCVPMIFEDGMEGYVSESRDLATFQDNQKTWMSAFCKEIGLENVKTVIKADDKDLVKDKYPVLLCDPKCLTDNPHKIGNCPSGPYNETNCIHENIPYITCEIEKPTNWDEVQEANHIAKEALQNVTKVEKEAIRVENQTAMATEKAINDLDKEHQKLIKEANKNESEAAAEVIKVEKVLDKLENDLDNFRTDAYEEANKKAEEAGKEADKKIKAAEKLAIKAQKKAIRAFNKANRLKDGSPQQTAALDVANKLQEIADDVSKNASQTAKEAKDEADINVAEANQNATDKIEKAEKEAESSIKEAKEDVENAKEKEQMARRKAERLPETLANKLSSKTLKYEKKEERIVEKAKNKVTNAKEKATKLQEKADNLTLERYDLEGKIIPFE